MSHSLETKVNFYLFLKLLIHVGHILVLRAHLHMYECKVLGYFCCVYAWLFKQSCLHSFTVLHQWLQVDVYSLVMLVFRMFCSLNRELCVLLSFHFWSFEQHWNARGSDYSHPEDTSGTGNSGSEKLFG